MECPACGIRGEQVPWARAGSRFTRAFEDTSVFLARAAPKSVVAELMRVDWASVGRMIERVVTEHAASRGDDRLDGLVRTGIDEVAYRTGHRYLMCVVCHDSGRVVWAAEGRSQAVRPRLSRKLGPSAVSYTFASLMIAAAVNAKALSTYMGHANIAITLDRYWHLMPGNEDEAASLLDAYLGRAETAARLAQLD